MHALWIILFLLLASALSKVRSYKRLAHIPGPRTYAFTSSRLAWDAWNAKSVHSIRNLHQKCGPVVRVGSNQVSFNTMSALKTIYGAGSGFDRTSFYKMFDVYGKANLFTFASNQLHRERKKLVSNVYSNNSINSTSNVNMIKRKVDAYLEMLDKEPDLTSEVFTSLHYFSFDAISEFLYGQKLGGTNAMQGNKVDRRLIDDILDPARRRLAWFGIHFPAFTKWVTTRTGISEKIVAALGLLPMQKPFTYTGIRRHAWESFQRHKAVVEEYGSPGEMDGGVVMSRLFDVRKKSGMDDLDIASEAADHLLAGIDTTADSLMFLFWALSLPEHAFYQESLRSELSSLKLDNDGHPQLKELAQLPWLNAVLRESLRLYTPLPAFEPRSCSTDTIIDGVFIPAGTVVGMSPYCLHREESVFPEPFKWDPSRWITAEGKLLPESAAQNRWFWAFSSGARMCIGIHLANAEMLMLTSAVYLKYQTVAKYPDATPGITSRYEVFYDETKPEMKEHECELIFKKIAS